MSDFALIGGAIVFIILVAVLAVWFARRANAKYAELWPPLASQVSGTYKSSKMNGSYEGRPIQARINSTSDDNSTTYLYELALTAAPQGKDWALSYTGDKLLGMGQKSWHVKTKDDLLKQRLIDAGAPALVERWDSYPQVSYKAKSGTLKYEQQVGGMHALPAPEQFKAQLELMSRMAQLNSQVNV